MKGRKNKAEGDDRNWWHSPIQQGCLYRPIQKNIYGNYVRAILRDVWEEATCLITYVFDCALPPLFPLPFCRRRRRNRWWRGREGRDPDRTGLQPSMGCWCCYVYIYKAKGMRRVVVGWGSNYRHGNKLISLSVWLMRKESLVSGSHVAKHRHLPTAGRNATLPSLNK